MLNHIAVWHEITARRLRRFRETGVRPPSPGEEEAINAQAAADADMRTRAMIFARLDDSFARLAAEEGWPVAVIAANTWEHYAEHRADLEPGS